MTHICVGNLTIIGSDNGLSPGRRQAITWTNVGILLIGPLETNFSDILIEIHTFSFKKIHLKMSSGKCRPCCLGLNVLKESRPRLWSMAVKRIKSWNCYLRRKVTRKIIANKLVVFTNLSTKFELRFRDKTWSHSVKILGPFLDLFFSWAMLPSVLEYLIENVYLIVILNTR